MDMLVLLERGMAYAGERVAGARGASPDGPTPCREWTLGELLHHLSNVTELMGAVAGGMAVDPAALSPAATVRPGRLGDDPIAAFPAAGAGALAVFREPGALERPCAAMGGMAGADVAGLLTLDEFAHGWDVAVATGQPAGIDDALAVALLELARRLVPPGERGGFVGPPVDPGEGAAPTEVLMAYLGRRP